MIMILIIYLEYNINKRVKTFLSLTFKIWTYMISQFVYTSIVFGVWKKIFDPAILVGYFFFY